jgi:hypothetical protein
MAGPVPLPRLALPRSHPSGSVVSTANSNTMRTETTSLAGGTISGASATATTVNSFASSLNCPLTKQIMRDPVFLAGGGRALGGRSYLDYSASWLRGLAMVVIRLNRSQRGTAEYFEPLARFKSNKGQVYSFTGTCSL